MASSRRQYPFHLIEPKWQQTWEEQQAFRAFNPGDEILANHPFAQRHKLSGKVAAQQLPALTLLEWIEFPVLAVGHDGSIVFANWAFADVIGLTPEMVMSLKFRQIFDTLPEGDSPIAVVRTNAGRVIDLMHLDGSKVRVMMSECLLLGDYEVAVATFNDLTERPWNE